MEIFPKDSTKITDLPILVVEYILSNLNYHDILQLRLVSKNWNLIITDFLYRARRSFLPNLPNLRVEWVSVKDRINCDNPSKKMYHGLKMTPRFFYLTCYCKSNNNLYMYGGCTSQKNIYNDLWRFDLNSKTWFRIIAEGTLPIPRLFASFSLYNCKDENTNEIKQYLVLFGGAVLHVFTDNTVCHELVDTIHFYDIKENRWTLLKVSGELTLSSYHHSASIIDDDLIVSYGIRNSNSGRFHDNSIYVFDLKKHYWRRVDDEKVPYFDDNSANFSYNNNTIPKKPNNYSIVLNPHYLLFVRDKQYEIRRPVDNLALLKRVCSAKSCVSCQEILKKDNNPKWQWISLDHLGNQFEDKCSSFCMVGNLLAYLAEKNNYYTLDQTHSQDGKDNNKIKIQSKRERQQHRLQKLDYYHRYYSTQTKQKIIFHLKLVDMSKLISDHTIEKIKKHQPMNYYTVSPLHFKFATLDAANDSLILFGCYSKPDANDLLNKLYLLIAKPEAKLD